MNRIPTSPTLINTLLPTTHLFLSAEMRFDHICAALGYQVAARQQIKNTVVTNRDTVVDRDGVEFLGDSARRFDLARDHLAQVLQMDVAGDELGEAVDHRDDGLAEILVLHPRRAPQDRKSTRLNSSH